MKKFILSAMAAMVSMVSMAALEDFNGTYVQNDAQISYYVPKSGSQTSALAINVAKKSDNVVTLSINNFSFNGMVVGNITADLDAALSSGDYDLSSGKIDGPDIKDLGISTQIEVTSGALYEEGGNKKLDLNLSVYIKGTTTQVAQVVVSGAVKSAATSVKEASKLSVYPTAADSYVNVPENGEFVIYSVGNGAAVKTGVVNNGTVSVSDLVKGAYILSVNGKNARIIKK